MDERLKVLEMVQAGKISPEQAVELLNAMEDKEGVPFGLVDLHEHDQSSARRLRITGLSAKGSKKSFDIPLGVLKFFNGLFPNSLKMNINQKHLDREQLMELIYTGEKGIIYHEEDDRGSGVIIELI